MTGSWCATFAPTARQWYHRCPPTRLWLTQTSTISSTTGHHSQALQRRAGEAEDRLMAMDSNEPTTEAMHADIFVWLGDRGTDHNARQWLVGLTRYYGNDIVVQGYHELK